MGYMQTNSKGKTYYLNTKAVTLKGGRVSNIYYFSGDNRADTACDLPATKEVSENPANGMLMLRNKA